MKLLGIDFGTRRVGLAMTDPSGAMAFPYATIHRTTRDKLFQELLDILEREQVEGIVVGLPGSREAGDGSGIGAPMAADGEEALIVRQIRNFVDRLQRRTPLPVHLVDETLSSFEAEQTLRESGLKGEKLKEKLDQQAAVLILRTYLESRPV